MKKLLCICLVCLTLPAAQAGAGIIVTSVWKRVAHTDINTTSGARIAVESNMIAIISSGYYGQGDWSQYWYSTNDGANWSAKVNFGSWAENGPSWHAFYRRNFFLLNRNPFGIGKQGYIFYSTNSGITWNTNYFIPPDHKVIYCGGGYDPATTNLHVYYFATNALPSTNVRYAVYTKRPDAGWDVPSANVILGNWPGRGVTDYRGISAFKDQAAGRWRSVRARTGEYNDITTNAWLCTITNAAGGVVTNIATPLGADGIQPDTVVAPDGTIYMVHVSNEGPRLGTNLLFTAFRYDESAGISIITNQVLAHGSPGAPDYHYVACPCIDIGTNGEIIITYLAGGDGAKMTDVRIIMRDRLGRWWPPVTVASGDSDTPGVQFPGAGIVNRIWGGYLGGIDMAVVREGDINYVYLYYGEYRNSIGGDGARTRNGVVHKLKVYDPPPPKGTIVTFK